MAIEDTLDLTETFTGTTSEHFDDKYLSVKDKNIEPLLMQFFKQRVVINEEDSEKEFCYKIRGELKKSLIPFNMYSTRQPDPQVTRFILRGPSLEIDIADYHESDAAQNSLVDGGSYRIKAGIMCKIKFEGPASGEDTVFKVKDTLRNFYSE